MFPAVNYSVRAANMFTPFTDDELHNMSGLTIGVKVQQLRTAIDELTEYEPRDKSDNPEDFDEADITAICKQYLILRAVDILMVHCNRSFFNLRTFLILNESAITNVMFALRNTRM